MLETSNPDDQNTIAREVGVGAAEYLTRLIRPNDKIVMSWGNSLLGMVNALTLPPVQMRNLSMIQGLGGLGNPNVAIHGAELVRRAAKALSAQPVLFPAPAIAATAALLDAIYADPFVSHTLELARSADLAFVGIGSADKLHLAKAAIAAGFRLLLTHLAGAFGNYVQIESAIRIGLLEAPRNLIHAAGNTALRSARMLLLADRELTVPCIEHVASPPTPLFKKNLLLP